MRTVRFLILAVCSCWLFAQPALADKRVALVIGNSAYQSVNRLTNPANDSAAIAETLKSAGFNVVDLKKDLKAAEMRRALRDFSDKVRDADMAVVYYAGHGMEIDGTNYLIPVDAVLERDIDAYDEAISLDRVLTVIEPAKQLRLVILDACRDNPFNQTMKRTIATRAVSRGLAKIEPNNPNTLVAFAARAGSTASDGDSKNSPFTAALVKYLPRPGLDLRKVFGFTRDDVLRVTNNKQEPFLYGSLGGDDVALVPGEPVVMTPGAIQTNDIRKDYELALQIGDEQAWNVFLRNYPTGYYADLAKIQLERIAAEKARATAATDAARSSAEEEARQATERARKAEQGRAAAEAKADEAARSTERVQKDRDRDRDRDRAKPSSRNRVVARRTAPAERSSGGGGGGGLNCNGPAGFVGCVAHSIQGGRVE